MMDTESGRAPTGQALVSDEAPAGLHPSGFDPSRFRCGHPKSPENSRHKQRKNGVTLYRCRQCFNADRAARVTTLRAALNKAERDAGLYKTLLKAAFSAGRVSVIAGDDAVEAWADFETCADAIATEARRAETLGSVHEGAGPQDIAQGTSP